MGEHVPTRETYLVELIVHSNLVTLLYYRLIYIVMNLTFSSVQEIYWIGWIQREVTFFREKEKLLASNIFPILTLFAENLS